MLAGLLLEIIDALASLLTNHDNGETDPTAAQ
jgi:hypothetical protein